MMICTSLNSVPTRTHQIQQHHTHEERKHRTWLNDVVASSWLQKKNEPKAFEKFKFDNGLIPEFMETLKP